MITIKYLIACTVLSLCLNTKAQKITIGELKLNDSTIYFFCRGTKAKTALISEKFNIQDKFSSHVGIGYFDGQKVKIYNVSDEKSKNESALVIDSLDSFITEKTYYFAIYKCNNNYDDLMRMQAACDAFSEKPIAFDFSFTIDNGNNFYCSEFCATVIMQTNSVKYNYAPSDVILDALTAAYLKRQSLTYYPVDFFQGQNNCSKIFEAFIPQTD